MSDTINLLRNVASLDVSPLLDGYTKVVIIAGTDENGELITYTAGSDGGAVLTVENSWGSQTMANNMLAQIQGWAYQPYSADGALLDPAAELGDGISVNDIYGGLFHKTLNFGSLMSADIGAPKSEEIEHEYTGNVESTQDRAFSRLIKAVNTRITQNAGLIQLEAEARNAADEAINSQLSVQAGQIAARVSKSGGSSSSFGWTLTDSSWELKSNNRTVLRADSSGLHIEGEITAKSGTIGGFDIMSTYLSYGGMTWSGSASSGIYIGTSGIKLGQYFKVDTMGNLTANRITANGGTIGGIDIGSYGISGDRWSMSSNGVSFGSNGFSLNSSGVASISSSCRVNGGDTLYTYVGNIAADKITANYINSKIGEISLVRLNSMQLGGHTIARSTIDGNKVLTWI